MFLTKQQVDTFITSTPHNKQYGHFGKKELFSECKKLYSEKENVSVDSSTGEREKTRDMNFSINKSLKNSNNKSRENLEELHLCLQTMKEENKKKD